MGSSIQSTKPDTQAILIVGAGPVGLVTALELAHHGVASVLMDRSSEPTRFPKMDITNGRSMELFRRLGFADHLRSVGVPPEYGYDVIWTRTYQDVPIAVWRQPSSAEQTAALRAATDGSLPLEADMRMPQYAFEQEVRQMCRQHPLIDLREGWAFESLTQDEAGVTATIIDGEQREALRCQYLVGCDGAGSAVRRQLGIELEGADLPRNVMFHFKSNDLQALHRHGRFWHIYGQGVALIAQDEIDTWTCHFTWPPGAELPDNPDLASLLAERLGIPVRIDEVLLQSTWTPRMMLATAYSQGRVFLAGDAVHQVFPTGGYGMNTGIGDAVDIGWKLAAVVNGWGGPGLLQSYAAERRPVGATNREYSGRHLGVIVQVAMQLAGGASNEEIAAFVLAHRGENTSDGVEFGYRYSASPVVVHEAGTAPPWESGRYVPSTWPGARAPSFLEDGSALFDHFGKDLTLVDFSDQADGAALVSAARDRGIPMTHLRIKEAAVKAAWERRLVLVRPDQHVAWRSDAAPDAGEWLRILGQVCGLDASMHSSMRSSH
jgi:2-polyprenyl-6-methoxyphenol hydroxylase-like FAD-dependent oxidoreductase